MTFTIVSINKPYYSVGEQIEITAKLKMGSGESVKNNFPTDLFYIGDDGIELGELVASLPRQPIAKGGSATYTISTKLPDLSKYANGRTSFGMTLRISTDYYNSSGGPWGISLSVKDFATYIVERKEPQISGVSYLDYHEKNPLAYFGNYVQERSVPDIQFHVSIDAQDPTNKASAFLRFTSVPSDSKIAMWYGSAVQNMNAIDGWGIVGDLDINFRNDKSYVIDRPGTYEWCLELEDFNSERKYTKTGSFTVLSYQVPVITSFTGERYKEVLDDTGQKTYPAADDGQNVRYQYRVDVPSSLNGRNPWSCTIVRSDTNRTIFSKSGVGSVSLADNPVKGIDTDLYDSTKNIEVTLTVQDYFVVVQRSVTIPKAGGFMNIEKFGVAVGQRSTGSLTDKRFEVAPDYTSHFYGPTYFEGGVYGMINYREGEAATGNRWIDGKPIYRYVFIASFTGTGNKVVGNLPVPMAQVVSMTGSIIHSWGFTQISHSPSSDDNSGAVYLVPAADYQSVDVHFTCGTGYSGIKQLFLVVEYTKDTDNPVFRPLRPMTANSSINCVASASSVLNTNDPAWHAFDGLLTTIWSSKDVTGEHWIQIQLPEPLKNIVVDVYSRDNATTKAPTQGKVMGSNDGSSWTQIGSYSGWDDTLVASLVGKVECHNSTAYSYVRLTIDNLRGSNYIIGNILIHGDR